MKPIIKTEAVKKVYNGRVMVNALAGIELEISKGAFVVIAGPSGSGKSTLLHLLGGLDVPTEGSIEIDGHNISRMSKAALSDFRLKNIGFIFQAYNLLPVLSLEENVEFGLRLKGISRNSRKEKVLNILRELDIEAYAERLPGEISGGQQQRAAIARAMVGNPSIIFADEPTANLDSQNADKLIDLMRKQTGSTASRT